MERTTPHNEMMMDVMNDHMSDIMSGMMVVSVLWIILTLILIILGSMMIVILYRQHFKNSNRKLVGNTK
ncbi:hypothetical protein FJZ39_00055 [Candidatus Saccharibacteria bacterium]|nr:hypothetical protein [Candidatus Saccharibacteria bacterium]